MINEDQLRAESSAWSQQMTRKDDETGPALIFISPDNAHELLFENGGKK